MFNLFSISTSGVTPPEQANFDLGGFLEGIYPMIIALFFVGVVLILYFAVLWGFSTNEIERLQKKYNDNDYKPKKWSGKLGLIVLAIIIIGIICTCNVITNTFG